jgi:hypothetical protein
MPVKYSSILADKEREYKGDWVEYPFWKDVAFRVSAINLPAYQTARALMYQELRKKYGKDTATYPEEEMAANLGALLCDHILHDWRGFDEEYSPELARKDMTSYAGKHLVPAVLFCAEKLGQIDLEFTEELTKNSERPSAGD